MSRHAAAAALALGIGAAGPSLESAPATRDQPQLGPEVILAPGWGELGYAAPEPGTYRLPALGEAADGRVIDVEGRARRLHELFGGRVVLLAFIYSSCSDANGCPLATAVMHGVHKIMQRDPELGARLRLISLSFDPERDTPQRLRLYAKGATGLGAKDDWLFLTSASAADLAPVLAAYGQTVQRELGAGGDTPAAFAHVLRVFLIDRERRIRNIYSASFLHRDLVLADVRTLLREDTAPTSVEPDQVLGGRTGAGDSKDGYELKDYRTRSRSLQDRRGRRADLLAWAQAPQLGLPPLPVPEDNPLTAEKVELGRKLFYDRRLSLNDTFSCAMCHIPEQGFTSNEMATAVGIEGRTVRRNAPTLLNVAYPSRLFHDGRETSLEQQVWGPLLAPNEMGNPSIGALLEKIKGLPDYRGLFEAAFGRGPTMETLGMALASYQRTLLAAASPFDRWYFGGEEDAVSDAARRGFDLFRGRAGCVACHRVDGTHALFMDQDMHNTGIGFRRAMDGGGVTTRVQIAPGTYLEVDRKIIERVGEAQPSDLGLYEVTQNPADRWRYRTPTLRNLALTAPYMHDGSLGTLADVIELYDRGGEPNPELSPLLRPLGLNPTEKGDLLAFLQSLTGEGVDTLLADAFAAEIGDPRPDDPHWARDIGGEAAIR